jgi:hypothetical protein
MISAKQQEANQRNAQNSTGPKTPEGKDAVRFNALKHGLRARSTILPFENPEEFNELCAGLEDDWQPQTNTERMQVEQLAIHQWLLRRLATFECCIYMQPMDADAQMTLLERFSAQRARLEHSFSKTMRDLEHLQQHRPKPSAADPHPLRPAAAQPPVPDPQPPQPESAGNVYVMSPDTP